MAVDEHSSIHTHVYIYIQELCFIFFFFFSLLLAARHWLSLYTDDFMYVRSFVYSNRHTLLWPFFITIDVGWN